jgi:hypothetical protein
MTKENTPKIQAIDAVRLAPPPPIRAGVALPANINATQYIGSNQEQVTLSEN